MVEDEQKGFSVRVLEISDSRLWSLAEIYFQKRLCRLLQFHDTKIDPKTKFIGNKYVL